MSDGSGTYAQDGLQTGHNHEFMADAAFQRAYARGVQAAGQDYGWHWRVHVGLWAARTAAALPGDFVECGVNRGFMASAIMAYLDWNTVRQPGGRRFFLLDTFAGIDLRYVTDAERASGIEARNAAEIASGFYTTDVEGVRRNFAEWAGTVVVAGSIPETLAQVTAARIAFLHIDLNCSPPEVAAIGALWDRLVPGAVVLLDDYAYAGYREQKRGMDAFARSVGVEVMSLPTGQGLLVKPATPARPRLRCTVCGGHAFADNRVLWPALVDAWELGPAEHAAIDRQQGTVCTACGANLRSIALADAVRAWAATALTLRQWLATPAAQHLAVLELNEAGMLSPWLRPLSGHVLARYPAIDMQALPYAAASFDLVIHSDTLEHVPDPVRALAECRRVLAPAGALCFTVPAVMGRLTRRRDGLPPSFHNTETTTSDDMRVHTEYGADHWTQVIAAGFSAVSVHTVDFPSATALLARRDA